MCSQRPGPFLTRTVDSHSLLHVHTHTHVQFAGAAPKARKKVSLLNLLARTC